MHQTSLTFKEVTGVSEISAQSAYIISEFKNQQCAKNFGGLHSFKCSKINTEYCDPFVVLAEPSRTVERVDEHGAVQRLPVFKILELGDRY